MTTQNSTMVVAESKSVTYTALGETAPLTLTVAQVKKFIAVRTASGKEPSDQDIVKFLMLCQAKQLNPWVGDAYLVGYDGKDGPTYSQITAFQAVLKRAEMCSRCDGIEGGVIIDGPAGLDQRLGEFVLPTETLVGAWARVHRTDRNTPTYISVNRETYDKQRSQWKSDPAGMLVKCAKAKALREAFPSQVGGMFIEGEHLAETENDTKPKRIRTVVQATLPRDTAKVLRHDPQVQVQDEDDAIDETQPEVDGHIYDEPK